MPKFGFVSFLTRLGAALVIVLATFNPSGYSYYHLLAHDLPKVTPLAAVLGLVLLIAWGVFIRATLHSIGRVGVLLGLALFGAFIWLIHSWGVDIRSGAVFAWIVLVVLAAILAVGMSWSHLYRRWSGQVDVEEIEEGGH
jgi:hypothetical protein